MPKAKLVFELPDEKNEFKVAVKGMDYFLALWDFSQHLRHIGKYWELKPEEEKMHSIIAEQFHDILDEKGINLAEIE